MAEKQINGRIVHKHDAEANWNKATNFIPKNGEIIIYDPDSNYSYARVKVGDGTTKVTSLPFIDNAIKTAQTNLSDTVNSVKNNSITGLSVSGRTITYTKGSGATGTITTQDNNTTYSAGTGLSLSGTTFNHKNSITAATAQGDASKTLAFGDTFTIPTITYDAQGHITGKGTTTMTMPAGPVAKEGNPVSEWGIKGTGISVETTFSPIQSGSGDPYPAGGGKNLFDYKSYSSKNSNIEITISGDNVRMYTTSEGTYRGLKYESFTAVAGTSYTGSFTLNTYVSGVMTVGLRNASTNSFLVSKKVTKTGSYSFTYTPTENVEVYPSILITNDSVLSGDVTFSKVQLEVGSTATEYAPYSNIRPISGFDSVKLTRCGKNLLKNTATTQTVNGITFTVNSDGTVKANGTATATAILTLVTSTSNPELRDALLGNQITLSGCPSGGSSKTYDLRIYQYADANSYLMDYGSGKTATFTNAELPFNIAILIRSGVKVNNLVFRPQIELGSTATAYEPYQGDTFTADFGRTVYGGTLDWNTGMLTVNQNIKVFDGTEAWYLDGSSFSYAYAPTDIDLQNGNGVELISSHYKCAKTASEISGTKGQGKILQWNNNKWYINHDSQALGLDGWKAYLAAQYEAGTPVQVVYKLATSTTIQLSPQDLKMLDSVNTIYSDGNSNYVIFNNGNSNLGKASELFLNKTSILPISNGGTGASSENGACSNIGALPTSGGTMTGFLTIKNSSSSPYIDFKTSTYNKNEGTIHYLENANETSARFYFRQYSRSSSTYEPLNYSETYYLPNTDADRTSTASYNILTSKNTVSVAQGGTGKTTAQDACNLFLNSLSTGSSKPEDTDYYICQYAGGGTSTTTYHRRPTSALYNYIKAKTDTLYPTKTGSGASGSWGISITGSSASCTGNAATATKLATARTLTIGNTGKTFNGSGNVSWSLSEIGAAASNHTHSYLPLSGGTLTGYLTLQNDATYPRLLFKSSSYDGSQGEMFYRILSDEASSNFLFRQYCRSSKDYSLLSTYEDFKLPQTTADRTYSGYYDILTTKSAVTVAQGGTGASTAAGARENLGAYPQADMVFTTGGSEQTTSIKFGGKTVYRKIYSIGSISANGTKQIDTGLTTTIDIIFNLRGVARLAESQYRIPLPYASNQSGYNYQLQMVGVGTTPKINITAGTAAIASGFVILEYTKL